MQSKTSHLLLGLFVVGLVALSGCAGNGDTTAEATPTATETATATETMDGGDETTDSTGDVEPTTSPEATTTATETATPTATPADGPDGYTPGSHAAALREAGSYTISYTMTGVGGGSDGATTSFEGTQRVDLESEEYHAELTTSTAEGNLTTEYYQPPGSDTVYQYTMGQVQETSADSAILFNISEPGTGTASAGSWPNFSESGSGETDLGSATRYVVDSVEDLPAETREAYDSIESLSFEIWVDDETGVIARYDYSLEYVQDGESGSIEIQYELTDLGSTTIEEPDWVP